MINCMSYCQPDVLFYSLFSINVNIGTNQIISIFNETCSCGVWNMLLFMFVCVLHIKDEI